jgi:hypothetical protein
MCSTKNQYNHHFRPIKILRFFGEAKIEEYENEYKQATREERKEILLKTITAKEGRLHDLNEELKALRQQGNEQRTRPFIYGSFISNRVVLLTIISCHPILFKYSAHINENNTIYCFV